VGVLNLSFTLAKTLALSLGQTVADLEAKTQQQIMTTFEIEQLIKGNKP
jgi:hypothetical protein